MKMARREAPSRLRVPPAQGPVWIDCFQCIIGLSGRVLSAQDSADSLPSGKSDGDVGNLPHITTSSYFGERRYVISQIVLIDMSPKNNTTRVGGHYA